MNQSKAIAVLIIQVILVMIIPTTLANPIELNKNRTQTISRDNETAQIESTKINSTEYGNSVADSIFRPALFNNFLSRRPQKQEGGRSRLRSRKNKKEQANEEEEEGEEEVTQTIELPLSYPDEKSASSMEESYKSESNQAFRHPYEMSDQHIGRQRNEIGSTKDIQTLQRLLEKQHSSRDSRRLLMSNLKPEASLTLSNTEMGSILHDREGPESYRSRELAGEGVHVGEEPPRLGTSASGLYPMDSVDTGALPINDYGSSSFPQTENPINFGYQRLMNAESEAYSRGFAQRFGSIGNDERLMHQPNEYNEVNSPYGPGHHEVGDFGQSGLLRASTGSEYGNTHLNGFYGQHNPSAFAGPFGGQPLLDRHASELVGGPHDAIERQRALATDSYYPPARFSNARSYEMNNHNFPPSSYGTEESVNNHYHGQTLSDEVALNEHGFNNLPGVHGFHQRNGRSDESVNLEPLSPVINTADEIPGSLGAASNNGDHFIEPIKRTVLGNRNGDIIRQPTSTGQSGTASRHPDERQLSSRRPIETGDETIVGETQQDNPESEVETDPNQSGQQENMENVQQTVWRREPSVEFVRVGSAGYMAPSKLFEHHQPKKNVETLLIKKTSFDDRYGESYRDPAENPAHRGKYIID